MSPLAIIPKRLSRALRNYFTHPLSFMGQGIFRRTASPPGKTARPLPGPAPRNPGLKTGRVRTGPYENLRRRKAELLLGTGRLLREMGCFSRARQHLARALLIHPGFAAAALDLADLLISEGRMTEAVDRMTRLSAIYPGFGPAHLKKARALGRLGDINRALAALDFAASLMPGSWQVHQELGLTLMRKGRTQEARAAFETALNLNPDSAATRHMLDAAAQNLPNRAPPDYVTQLYDRYAAFFEDHMTGPLHYTVPMLLKKRLRPHVRKNGRFAHLIDLGCGTGMTGFCLKNLARFRTGVDISRKMLLRAKGKAVYHTLVHMDLERFLSETKQRFDLAVAADVLIYFGELPPLMDRVKARLNTGGLFAFSIESTRKTNWRLRPSGRFAHSAGYVLKTARGAAFSMLLNEKIGIRMENGRWVNGRLIILKA